MLQLLSPIDAQEIQDFVSTAPPVAYFNAQIYQSFLHRVLSGYISLCALSHPLSTAPLTSVIISCDPSTIPGYNCKTNLYF